MSVMEKALREIDARRHPSDAATAADDPLALTRLPLQPPATPRGRLLPWVGLVAIGALAGWVATVWWHTPTDGSAALATATTPASSAPATALAEAILRPPATGLVGEEWLVQAGHVWLAGLHDEAARLWVSGLRGLPPHQLALMVADHQDLAAARELHRQWASQWPLVVLPRQGMGEPRWLVLAVPTASDLERARQQLAQATHSPVVWATMAEWINPLALAQVTPAASEPPAPLAQAAPVAPAPAPNPAPAPAKPAAAPAPALAAAPTTRSAPTLPAPANAKPTSPAPSPAPSAAPNPVPAPAPLVAAAPKAAPRAEDAPAVVRQSGPEPTDAQRSAAAAQSIDNAFTAVERQLAAGDHAGALDAALHLEQNVGATWRTQYLRGVALSGLGRWPEAVTVLAQAHQRNPAHLRVGIYLAVAMQENGDHGPALEVLTRLNERHPQAPEPWLNKGHSLQAQGRPSDAAQAYQRFLALSEQRGDLQAQRQWVKARLNKDN